MSAAVVDVEVIVHVEYEVGVGGCGVGGWVGVGVFDFGEGGGGAGGDEAAYGGEIGAWVGVRDRFSGHGYLTLWHAVGSWE